MSADIEHFKSTSARRRCSLDHRDHVRSTLLETPLPDLSDDCTDDDVADETPLEIEDQAILVVSISPTQTHLASSKTPAAEKQAALWNSIGERLDGVDDCLQVVVPNGHFGKEENVTPDSAQTLVDDTSYSSRLPSPWRAEDNKLQVADNVAIPPTFENKFTKAYKSFFNFHLPPSPRYSFSNASSAPQPIEQSTITKPQAHKVEYEPSVGVKESLNSLNRSNQLIMSNNTQPRLPLLRRSVSDSKFFLERQVSITSSLGDDTRFENVNEQINSRLRALKDTWADSNFRMPRMPSFTHLNFGAPWAELPRLEKEDQNKSNGIYSSRSHLGNASSSLSRGALPVAAEGTTSSARKLTTASGAVNPELGKAMDDLVGDVIILGGYRGSVLRSAKPPHRQLWVPMKVGLNLRKANLELGLTEEDEIHSEDLIIPSGMLKSIGPVDISKRLFKRLRSSQHAREGRLRVWDYGYDWRLSPHLLSRQLLEVLEDLPCNSPNAAPNQRGAIVIAHSLGGLITRHAVNQRPDLFAGVVYAGVPQHCVNILGPLRNGDDVMLSSRVLTAQVNFSIRTTFALLPLDGKCFVDSDTREPIPVDFFDIQSWDDYGFSPCISRPLPPLNVSQPQGFMNRAMGTVTNAFPMTRGISYKSLSNKIDPIRSDASLNDTSLPSNHHSKSMGAAAPQMSGKPSPQELGQNEETNVSTAVTIPKEAAMTYLHRTLSATKEFKQQLAYRDSNATLYPPTAVLFGKSLPTVSGCRVRGRDGIKRADAYDNLIFASGDGVVLARAAMLPEGYRVASGGVVSCERGHTSLLGDLEAVGRCLNAVIAEQGRRRRGVVAPER